MSEFYRKEDVVQELAEYLMFDAQMDYMIASEDVEDWRDLAEIILKEVPTIEPNLILPERMERGECYEVGETIVVMNHDDYYDLLCRAMENEPKKGEWIDMGGYEVCKNCHEVKRFPHWNSCPNCGAKMKGADDEV